MLRSTKTPSPTHRAGVNMRDPSRSGFARVSVLDQQDLFPHEGYEFPDNRHKPPTNSYRISSDSPFTNKFQHSSAWREPVPDAINQTMNTMLRTEKICNRVAAKAIATPTEGELRPLHSQIAAQAIKKEREVQMRVREQMRLQAMKEDEYWADVEHEQGVQTMRVSQDYHSGVRAQQKGLAADYETQFELHRKREEEEKNQERQEADKIKQLQREDEEKEKKRQERLRAIAAERKKEFQLKNEELLSRRQRRIEQELEEEKTIQLQHAEDEERMAQREAAVRKRREDKNRTREKIIGEQSKRLAEMKAKESRQMNAAESEVAKREEARRLEEIERQKMTTLQRNKEYNEHVRQKDMAKVDHVDTPDFTGTEDDELRIADAKAKAAMMKKLRQKQEAQARERREKERRERMEQMKEASQGDTMYFLKDNEW